MNQDNHGDEKDDEQRELGAHKVGDCLITTEPDHQKERSKGEQDSSE